MSERRLFFFIALFIFIIFGKMLAGSIIKETMNNRQDEQLLQEQKKTVEKNKVEHEYSKKYPDMYVRREVVIPINEYDKDIINFKIPYFHYPVSELTKEKKKIAYLTFDDGPSENTSKVLKILDKYQAKGTFFVIGENLTPEYEDLLVQMRKEGHVIGIHTYCHTYRKIYASVDAYLDDFYAAYKRIYEILGEQPTIFRFPGGSTNSYIKGIKKEVIAEMERRGFTYYDWNVTAEDSVGNPTAASIMRNVLKDFRKYRRPIILMHDSKPNRLLLQVLDTILHTIKEEGYEFSTVDKR